MNTPAASLVAVAASIAALVALGGRFEARGAQAAVDGARWRTAWATSQQTAASSALANTTVRLIARVTVAGDSLRVRLDNTYGKTALRVGKAHAALQWRGAALVTGSNRPVLFAGQQSVSVPPGGSVKSDPVALTVMPMQDVAVSLYLPDADVLPSQHSGALTTSYLAAGDRSASNSAEGFSATMTTMPWLKAIDVLSSTAAGTIVAFGDSITDGTCGTVDAHDRWVDWLSVRLALDEGRRGSRDRHKAVVNEGIGGNTLTREGLQPAPDSTPGLERLERDLLSHEGVTDVILFMGTNDIRRGAPAAQVIEAMTKIAERVKARGIRIVAATIIPRHNVPASGTNSGWSDAKTAIRREVNQWIRTRAPFDGVLDFDSVVRDASNGDLIASAFNCDGIHPTPRGYFEMGRSISLDLFAR